MEVRFGNRKRIRFSDKKHPLGLATMVLSIIGFVLAVRCNKEEDIYHVTPAVGSVLNGIMILLFMVLFIKGAI